MAREDFEYYEGLERIMGTVFRLHAYHSQERGSWMRELADRVFDALQEDDRRLSLYVAGSEVNRINAAAGGEPVKVSEDTFRQLEAAVEWWRFTAGLFDVTVGALMRAWGYYRNVALPGAGPPSLEEARALTGCDKLELDPANRAVRLARPGMFLDLGGFAKGWCVQQRSAILDQTGLEDYVLSAGTSTVLARGAPPGQPGWPTHLEDFGAEKTQLTELILYNQAVSVSANYRHTLEGPGGLTVRHIMNPITFEPVTQIRRVVVTGPRDDDCEALSTALLVQGSPSGYFELSGRPGYEAYFEFPAGD
ncbi:MAG TPA: FAD:protein FMN transferase [Candidatus Glassbacteria bacterium]|nr:FAD:protein FMN transferase [Candidatus Glassbacteria bacterium]